MLGLLVLVNIARLGEGGWTFHPGKVRPDGVLGWFVSAANGHWTAAPLKYSAVAAGLVLVVALVYARERWTARRALFVTLLVTGLLLVPGVLFQAALRESSDPWFYTNDSTYQIEVAGDLVLDGQTPYGHDYRGTGIERFYSRDGTAQLDHMALDHFAYFPGAAITSAGWRLLPSPFDDYRFFVLLATLGLIPPRCPLPARSPSGSRSGPRSRPIRSSSRQRGSELPTRRVSSSSSSRSGSRAARGSPGQPRALPPPCCSSSSRSSRSPSFSRCCS